MAEKIDGPVAPDNPPGRVALVCGLDSPPPVSALFLVCLKVGLLSFGGGISGWLYQEFVVRKHWISDDDFVSSFAMSQILPGPSVVNLVISMGDQLRGGRGALSCAFGFLVGPFFAVILLSMLFDMAADEVPITDISNGVAFAAMGLIGVLGLQGVRKAMSVPPSLVIIAATAVAVGFLKFPLIPVVLVIAPISIALAWYRS